MKEHDGNFAEWPHKPIRVQLVFSNGITPINIDVRELVFAHFAKTMFPIAVEVRVIVGIDGEWVVAIADEQ